MNDLPPLPSIDTGRYRHYKGGEYEVLGVARHSETLEPLVLYRPLYNESGAWVRPFAMFTGTVEHEGHTQPRFARVDGPALAADHPVARWHELVQTRDPRGLSTWLAEDACFISPIVHAPQRGRALATAYLAAAFRVLGNDSFRYLREIVGPRDAMLEFETVLDGTVVNGIDLFRWNDAREVVEFKVMVRPLKAIERVRERMAAMLQG